VKDGITIRRSRRGRRTTIRIIVKGKAADDFIQALIEAQPGAAKSSQTVGGAHA
jgi:hypothetical protein